MNKLLIALLGLSAGACQHPAPPMHAATSKRQPAAVLPDSLALLANYNLAVLFRASDAESDSIVFQPQQGHLGRNRYLLEMALLSVRRDSLRPTIYWVQGKSRFKKVVTRFSGSIQLDRVVPQPKYLADSSEWMGYGDYSYYKQLPAYTASGTFVLREEATQPGAGVFRGTVAIDFAGKAKGTVRRECLTTKTPTQLGGLKFEGTWRGTTSGRVQPVLWLGEFDFYRGAGALPDLLVTNAGGRGSHLNPKYAHLGWSEAWQNNEWWADSPKPQLAL